MQLLSLFLVSSLRRTFQTIPPLLISVPPGIRLELGRRRISINGLATRLRSCLPLCLFFVFSDGRAEISEVSKCVGDAFLVTVRNKKRVGYTYELTLRVKGEWLIREEKKTIKGHIDVLEFSFGELDDLQLDGLEV